MIFMAKSSVARSEHESTDERVQRSRELFREHSVQFRHERGVWLVPSANDAVVGFYEVRLSPVEACECANFKHQSETCKHIHAAALAQSKSGTCSCCGQRVLDRFLSEVTEDDELLSWFVGDELCADCIRAGYWT
jgi:hypothetical protein